MMKRNNKGFTLVELMVVILIIGILVAIAVPVYNNVQKNAKEKACALNIRTIEGAVVQYYAEHNKYPKLSELCGNDKYIKEEPKCPFRDGDLGNNVHDYTISTDGTVTCTNKVHHPSP